MRPTCYAGSFFDGVACAEEVKIQRDCRWSVWSFREVDMIDIEKLIASVKFTCHSCQKESGCSKLPKARNEAKRLGPDPNEKPEIQIYCEHCGTTNTLGIEDIGRTNLGQIASSFLR
jgi:hypothetical protein